MKKLRFLSITITLCFIVLLVKAQSRQVQGTVRDAQGPIPGATVYEKGIPTNGAATTIDGKFKIALRGTSQVIVIKSQGYATREVKVNGNITLDITLEVNTQDLNEVAVVGYATVPKKTLTGAQSAVSGIEIRENPSASLQNTLAGRITGFISQQTIGRPGADGATFLIRGKVFKRK